MEEIASGKSGSGTATRAEKRQPPRQNARSRRTEQAATRRRRGRLRGPRIARSSRCTRASAPKSPGERLDVRAEVRRHSRSRVRDVERGRAHDPQRQGQGSAVPGDRRRARASSPRRPGDSLVLDGEIVALDNGEPARFQELQGRMHVKESRADRRRQLFRAPGCAHPLRHPRGWRRGADSGAVDRAPRATAQARRQATSAPAPRSRESIEGDGEKMLDAGATAGLGRDHRQAHRLTLRAGNRSRDWLKLKIEFRQEFVVGGYTEPRNSREHIGALLLGYFDSDRFIYVGHTGGGFTRKGWRRCTPAQAAREKDFAVRGDAEDQREGPLGEAAGRRRGQVQRVDRGPPAPPADFPRCPGRQGSGER